MSELETVFFIHVPKTAGTSFRKAVELAFPTQVARDYGPKSVWTSRWVRRYVYEQPNRERFRRELVRRDIKVFAGHVGRKDYGDVFPPEQTITFVRDPVQRVVSEWHHHRRDAGMQISLDQFAQLPGEPNKQTQLLGGVDLSRYALIGLTSHYRESLDLVSLRFGWDLSHLKENQNPDRPNFLQRYELSTPAAARLSALNQQDIQLYRRVVELLEPELRENLPALPRTPSNGALDRYETGQVYGWACRLGDTTPLVVRVLVNDQEIAVVTADRLRPDLRQKGIHPTGRAGFCADIGVVAPGSTIRCLVAPDNTELKGSPVLVAV